FVMLGLSALTPEAVSGAVLQMVNHGISTGALFLMIGILYERTHTRDLAAYGGLAGVTPAIAATFLIMTLSSIGLPGTNGFVGALLLLTSEVFLRTVKPAVLGPSPGLAEAAQRSLPPGSDAKPQAAESPPDRRYQAWVAAAFAAGGLWAAVAQMGDPAVPLFSGAAVSDGFGRVVAAVVCGALLLSCIVAF